MEEHPKSVELNSLLPHVGALQRLTKGLYIVTKGEVQAECNSLGKLILRLGWFPNGT
jgi:hypothetical protein